MDAEIPFSLGEYLDQLVDKLRALLPKAVKDGDEEAIHESRVATRRLRAAVDLFESIIDEKHAREFKRTLRRLRRTLGPLRDHDVMIGHLEKLPRSKTTAGATAWMIEQLNAGRARAGKDASKEISPSRALAKLGAWWGIREELLAARDSVDGLLAQSVHARLDDFRARADELAGVSGSSEQKFDPHELRIAGKALRYTLEMSRAQGHDLPIGVIQTFKKMQDSLGLWHDYVVLAENCMRLSADEMLAHHDAEMQDAVLALTKSILAKSKQQLAKFCKQWQDNGVSLRETIEGVFPRAANITEPQMDRDPASSEPPSDPEAPIQDGSEAA